MTSYVKNLRCFTTTIKCNERKKVKRKGKESEYYENVNIRIFSDAIKTNKHQTSTCRMTNEADRGWGGGGMGKKDTAVRNKHN